MADVVGGDEAADAELAAGDADDDLVLDDQRSMRDGVALLGLGDVSVPQRLAVLGVDGNQTRVDGAHEERVAGDRDSAIHAPAAEPCKRRRCVVVGPEHPPGRGVERDDVVGRLDCVHHAVDDQGRRLEFFERARLEDPLELQIPDVVLRDLGEGAVALAEHRAGMRQPVVRLAGGVEETLPGHLRVERSDEREHDRQQGGSGFPGFRSSWFGSSQRANVGDQVRQFLRRELVSIGRHRRVLQESRFAKIGFLQ